MSSTQIYQNIGGSVDNVVNAFITPSITSTLNLVSPLLIAALTLYIVVKGYNIILGGAHEPFADFVQRTIKMSVISMGFLSADVYYDNVVKVGNDIESSFISALAYSQTNQDGLTANINSTSSVYSLLDYSLSQAFTLADQAFGQSHIYNGFGDALAWTIAGVVIILAGIIITAVSAATIVGCKFMLAVLFAIGPLFFILLMFPITSRFFEGWLSQVLNFIFSIIFVGILAGFGNLMFAHIIAESDFTQDPSGWLVAGEVIVAAVILYWAQKNILPVVSVLTGGVSLAAATFTSLMNNPISRAGSAIKNALNRESTRYDRGRGQYVRDSRMGHLLRGNTLASKGYRDHVKANWRGNWAGGGKIGKKK